jgi:hypothetical protein
VFKRARREPAEEQTSATSPSLSESLRRARCMRSRRAHQREELKSFGTRVVNIGTASVRRPDKESPLSLKRHPRTESFHPFAHSHKFTVLRICVYAFTYNCCSSAEAASEKGVFAIHWHLFRICPKHY